MSTELEVEETQILKCWVNFHGYDPLTWYANCWSSKELADDMAKLSGGRIGEAVEVTKILKRGNYGR